MPRSFVPNPIWNYSTDHVIYGAIIVENNNDAIRMNIVMKRRTR